MLINTRFPVLRFLSFFHLYWVIFLAKFSLNKWWFVDKDWLCYSSLWDIWFLEASTLIKCRKTKIALGSQSFLHLLDLKLPLGLTPRLPTLQSNGSSIAATSRRPLQRTQGKYCQYVEKRRLCGGQQHCVCCSSSSLGTNKSKPHISDRKWCISAITAHGRRR